MKQGDGICLISLFFISLKSTPLYIIYISSNLLSKTEEKCENR